MYSERYYPAFCHGGMWTLSIKMINKLICASRITEKDDFYLEDVFITGNYLF